MTLELIGHVTNVQTRQGVAGLRVELWPRGITVNEPLKVTETGDDGRFRMELDQDAFEQIGEARPIGLVFRVYQADRLIVVKAAPEVMSSDQIPGEFEIAVDIASTRPLSGEGMYLIAGMHQYFLWERQSCL